MRWEGLGKWPQWVLSEWVSCQGPGGPPVWPGPRGQPFLWLLEPLGLHHRCLLFWESWGGPLEPGTFDW